MVPVDDVHYRTAEIYLFDTCTHKCGYCTLAESGKVLDGSQLRPYRDAVFIDKIVSFFTRRTSEQEKWLLTLTGGEPLLMPNFDRFVDALDRNGNRVALYTAMLVGDNHPSMRYLLERGATATDYLMVSFHPEAEIIEDRFFERLARLKRAGHNVILRFVSHPDRLRRLDELAEKCRDLDVAFYPTTLFSPDYPKAYAGEQRSAILRHVTSLSQIIQLESGLDTRFTRCSAGSELIAIDMRTGNITPCISVPGPILGNIYDDRLDLFSSTIACPLAGIGCICDVHFQQDIVVGAEDHERFERLKKGYVPALAEDELRAQVDAAHVRFSEATPGIGRTTAVGRLAFNKGDVKAAYLTGRKFFEGTYTEASHPEFKGRQFP